MLVTLLQITQFITMNAQALYILNFNCAYPHRVTKFYLYYIISLLVLFLNFFLHRWIKRDAKDKSGRAPASGAANGSAANGKGKGKHHNE